jgi:hypothetical protein
MEGQASTTIGDLSPPEISATYPLRNKLLVRTIDREQGSPWFLGWALLSFFG